jgi:hypothetical protein
MKSDRKMFTNMLSSFSGSLSGYSRLMPGVVRIVALLASVALASLLLALPLWFIATNFSFVYSVAVSAILAIAFVFYIIKKIATERLFVKIVKFIGLFSQLALILILFYQKILYYIPAIILSVEYLLFLGLMLRRDGFLPAGAAVALLVLTFFGYLYSILSMFASGNFWLGIPLSVFYTFAFGRIIIKKKKTSVENESIGNRA